MTHTSLTLFDPGFTQRQRLRSFFDKIPEMSESLSDLLAPLEKLGASWETYIGNLHKGPEPRLN